MCRVVVILGGSFRGCGWAWRAGGGSGVAKADEFQPQGVEFGVRLLADLLQDVLGVLADGCAGGGGLLLGEFDDPGRGVGGAETAALHRVERVGEGREGFAVEGSLLSVIASAVCCSAAAVLAGPPVSMLPAWATVTPSPHGESSARYTSARASSAALVMLEGPLKGSGNRPVIAPTKMIRPPGLTQAGEQGVGHRDAAEDVHFELATDRIERQDLQTARG